MKQRQCYIYRCIRTDTNEVFYVGSTVVKYRMHDWNRRDQPEFYKLVQQIGKDHCRSEIIEIVAEADRYDREAYWTKYYAERYNLVNRVIANNQYTDELRAKVFNPEVCAKMSQAWTDERKQQARIVIKSRWKDQDLWKDKDRLERMKQNVKAYWTAERRADRSARYKGENNPNYGNRGKTAGANNGMYGVHLSGELNGMYGKTHSADTRELISSKVKEAVNSPEYILKRSKTMEKKKEERIQQEKIAISEIFYSLQGESRSAGKPTIFVRTFGCPLNCTYCDSMYANTGSDFCQMTVPEIMNKIHELAPTCKSICVTGGEPLAQPHIRRLLQALIAEHYRVDVETSGCIDISNYMCGKDATIYFTVDYKCPTSGMEDRMLPEVFAHVRRKDAVKFVVGSEADLQTMLSVIKQYKFTSAIYVSPIFEKISLETIANFILSHEELTDVRFQLQLHKYIWPADKRGV